MTEQLVAAEGLAVAYDTEPALSEVSFTAGAGQTVAVLGPNGGGKTTLFRALVGELEPLAGTVTMAVRPAYVAQTDRTRLDLPVTALDVALMGTLAPATWWRPPRRAERRAAARALERVGLEDVADVSYGRLSGGQRQRALLARALAQGSSILLLDEPLGGADPVSAERIAALFDELRDEGKLLLFATHDADGASRFDRVLCLNRRQVAYGSPSEVLTREVLEETYGSEIMVLDAGDGRQVRAVAVQHHHH